jgi:hypothetical protein
MKFQDRIKEFRQVPANELLPHPRNWRSHNDEQRNALMGLLAEIGFADASIAYETPHGLQLIDGHLRAEVSGNELVPVLILDVTKEEADAILVSFDSVTSMANKDTEKFNELVALCSPESQAVADLLNGMVDIPVPNADDGNETGGGGSGGGKGQPDTGDGPQESDSLTFRKFEIPMSDEDADAFEAEIKEYAEATGVTHGFMSRIAKNLEV